MRLVDRIGNLAASRAKSLSQNEAVRPIVGASASPKRSRSKNALSAKPARVIKATAASIIPSATIRKPKSKALKLSTTAKITRNSAAIQRMFNARPHYYDIGVVANVPSPQRLDPVRTSKALLFPNKRTKSVMYSALTPTGLATTVVIRTEEIDDTVRTTGGSVTVSCSALPLRTDAEIEKLRGPWTAALKSAGHGQHTWRFVPLHIRSMHVVVNLPPEHLAAEPIASENAETAEMVSVIELNAIGALAWKQALEADDPMTLIGTITLDCSFAAEQPNRQVSTQSYNVSAPLGAIVTESVREMRILRAEVGVEARLIVRGHPIVDRIALSLISKNDVETMVLPSKGGEVSMTIATDSTADAAITWTADVSFSPPSWPHIAVNGELSQREGWATILAPATWIRSLDVMTLYFDDTGKLIEHATSSTESRVTGSIELKADFIEGRSLHTAFEGQHTEMVSMYLPDPPNQAPAQLMLTAMVFREGHSAMISHELKPNDRWVVIKVFPDARVEFLTNTSVQAEGSQKEPELVELNDLFF